MKEIDKKTLNNFSNFYLSVIMNKNFGPNFLVDKVKNSTDEHFSILHLIENNNDSFERVMMELDKVNYLPYDILVKVDRASMANSLETILIRLQDSRIFIKAFKKNLTEGDESKVILKDSFQIYTFEFIIEKERTVYH